MGPFERLRRGLAAIIFMACLPLLTVLIPAGWAIAVRISGNVHEVVPGELYRSAQLSGPFLNKVVTRYGIRTVINLRGPNSESAWYRDEVAATSANHIAHIDIAMSANREPGTETIDQLIAAFKTASKPILVHCEAGADRSGLASAIYELMIEHRPASESNRQLSFYYGHFPWLWSRTGAMDRAFEHLANKVH